jgi:hypothetical protein
METFKKLEKIINEWIQPILDKRIEEDGRWSQSAWKGGHHWELSADRFTIPRLLTLEMDDTHIRILISNTKRFNTSETHGFVERDNSEVITITKTDISFNEECKFDHFSHDEMYDLYNRIKAELKPEPKVYHLMNENITYKTDLKKILVGAALCDLCNQIADRVKDKKILILQSPLSFMDAYLPCSIMITKDWYDNNETTVWVRFDEFMLFAPDKIVAHECPSKIFSKAYYEADEDDCDEIECNDDEISEVLYGILSKVYNEPKKVIHNKSEESLRIVYEG